jgi:hypothetical protein
VRIPERLTDRQYRAMRYVMGLLDRMHPSVRWRSVTFGEFPTRV